MRIFRCSLVEIIDTSSIFLPDKHNFVRIQSEQDFRWMFQQGLSFNLLATQTNLPELLLLQ